MSEPDSYVERCVAAVASIDAGALSELDVGPEIGRGSGFAMRMGGVLGVLGADVHCGFKIDNKGQGTFVAPRLQQEVETIDLLLRHVPHLADEVPRFMAGLTIDGSAPVALLTEDASRGGVAEVDSLTQNYRLAHEIAESIKDTPEVRLHIQRTRAAVSFSVDGQERLLDFTPPPLELADSDDTRIFEIVRNHLVNGSLSLDIGSDSRLGQSLAAATV
jgi:hypothetical protein